jgi:hypothetical protein
MESIGQFVKDGRLLWTMTTNGYKFYTVNLIWWLRNVAKVHWPFCVICCDRESYIYFRQEGIACIQYDGKHMNQRKLASFETQEFGRIVIKKLEILHWISKNANKYGITKSLYIDGDIVVQRDPWPVLDGLWENGMKELAFQCDCSNDEEHIDCGVACTGVIAMKHTYDASPIWQFHKETWLKSNNNDQAFVGYRLKELKVDYSTLPRPEWCNGTWQKSMKWKDHNWVLLHYNYRVGDTKKAAMKEQGHWRIPY